jgi:hypothetical protein
MPDDVYEVRDVELLELLPLKTLSSRAAERSLQPRRASPMQTIADDVAR